MMALSLLTLLALTPLIHARIRVLIVVSDIPENSYIYNLMGSDIDIISDHERDIFQLSDSALKDAVQAYMDERPDDVYLKSPTPWGDLFQTYDWPQVTRYLSAQRGTILNVTLQPAVVLGQVLNSKTSKYKPTIPKAVQSTISHDWQNGAQLQTDEENEYIFKLRATQSPGVYEESFFSYTSKWGESGRKTHAVTLRPLRGVDLALNPNQSATLELHATKGTMYIQVDYKATLMGRLAVNFGESHDDHHFWGPNITSVMSAGGLPNSVGATEIITLDYYSNCSILVKDTSTDSVLLSVPMECFY